MVTAATSDLAERWNLRPVHGRKEWRGTCPACDYADAFALTERDGKALAWCASCNDRDAMAGLFSGLGSAPKPVAPSPHRIDRAADQARQKARAESLWRGAVPCPGTLAATYLAARSLPDLAASPALRFRPDTPHPSRCMLPAMLALVVDVAGKPMGLHRTYLRPDGTGKAAIDPPKATLGPVAGGAIRLHPEARELVIGEGIETAASAGRLMGLPAWAAISAGNMARTLALPATVASVVIAADADPPGRLAADAAAARWRAEGRRVRIALPDRAGWDFNDILTGADHG